MKPADHQTRQMLHKLGRALAEAVASSPEASQAVRRIREQGLSIHLVVDDNQAGEHRARIELTTRNKTTTKEPNFVLGGDDVTFLKSLGIDPTRPGRRRRRA